jgi:gliding motility-associated-like protein
LDCYYGATTPDPPQSFPPFWCTSIENNHFFAFTADANTASFTIATYGCASGGAIQAAVLATTDCQTFSFVSPCLGNIQSGSQQTLVASNLVPGNVYYLMIDGSAGAQCDYSINATLPLVNGPNDFCIPAAPATYTTTSPSVWTINPPSAGTFVGPSTGLTATVNWVEVGNHQICAQSTQCPNAPVECIDVEVGQNVTTTEQVDLCQGKTVECAGRVFTAPGSFPVPLDGFNGCDSIVTCVVTLIPTVFSNQTVLLCPGQSVMCAEEEFFNPGVFPVTFTRDNGCDSIVRCTVQQIPPIISPLKFITLCGPAEYQICDAVYNESGFYQEVCESYQGCDSTVLIDLAILEPEAIIAPPDTLDCTVNTTIILDGSASPLNTSIGGITYYFWTGPPGGILTSPALPRVTVNQPGEYCLIVRHSRLGVFCYDTTCVTVTAITAVPQLPIISGNSTPCAGEQESYVATAVGNPSPTGYNWSIQGNHPYTAISSDSIVINWGANVNTSSICVTAVNGCGSSAPACLPIQVLQQPVRPVLSGPLSVCADDGPRLFTLDTLQPGTDYVWTIPQGAVITGAGDSVYIDFAQAVSGEVCVRALNVCDTTDAVCLPVQVNPVPTAALTEDASFCVGGTATLTFQLTGNGPFDVVWFNGSAQDTLFGIANGHTIPVSPVVPTEYSLVSLSDRSTPACLAATPDTVRVQVWPHETTALSRTICSNESVFLQGAFRNTSGVYRDTLNTINGCDSVLVTTLLVNPVDTTILESTTCDPALAGFTIQNLTQANGCDSTVISTVVLLPTDSIALFETSCIPANVGVFVQNLQNGYGCDSTVVTTVSFSLSDSTYIGLSSCSPLDTGRFEITLINSEGCDSTIITTVALLPSNTTFLTRQDCNPNNVGITNVTLTNQFGCDSVLVINTVLDPLPVTFLTDASCIPAQTGVFTQTYTTAQGCDSVVVTTVNLLPSNQTNLTAGSCNPNDVGVFPVMLTNQYGCDSLVITTVSLLPSNQTVLQATTCKPSEAGSFPTLLVNQYGCDSLVTRVVSLLPSDTTYLTFATCEPGQVGTIRRDLLNQYGCDSLVYETTALSPANACSVVASMTGSTIPCILNTGTLTILVTVGEAPSNYSIVNGAGVVVRTGVVPAIGTPVVVSGIPAGNYTVQISSVNGYGTSAQATVIQLTPPEILASVTTDYAGYGISCTGEADGGLQAGATGGLPPYTFQWSGGQSGTQVNQLPAGTYTVTVTDANDCTDTGSAVLREPAPFAITFTITNLDCFGTNAGTIIANPIGGAPPYRYTINGGTFQSSNTFNNLPIGVYTVQAYDANDCQVQEIIGINAPIPVNVSLGDNQTIFLGESTQLQALVNIPFDSLASVVWSPPFTQTECPTCPAQEVTPLFTTTYSIAVVDDNGCKDQDKVTIIVDRRRFVYVPNVFSPGANDNNDRFSIYAKAGTVTNIKSLNVYTRWGESVFAAVDLAPNDPSDGWDGTFRGTQLNPGVYVWFAEIEFIDGKVELYKGDVTLVR